MTKIETLIARATIVEKVNVEVAFCRGQLARAHNRPRTGTLVPRFETDDERLAFCRGWDDADESLSGHEG